jgi:hypothetical protein
MHSKAKHSKSKGFQGPGKQATSGATSEATVEAKVPTLQHSGNNGITAATASQHICNLHYIITQTTSQRPYSRPTPQVPGDCHHRDAAGKKHTFLRHHVQLCNTKAKFPKEEQGELLAATSAHLPIMVGGLAPAWHRGTGAAQQQDVQQTFEAG